MIISNDGNLGFSIKKVSAETAPFINEKNETLQSPEPEEKVMLSGKLFHLNETLQNVIPAESERKEDSNEKKALPKDRKASEERTIIEDRTTGRKFEINSGHNGQTLAVFPEDTGDIVPFKVNVGDLSMISYVDGLKSLIRESIWCRIAGNNKIEASGSQNVSVPENEVPELASRIEKLSLDPAKGGKPTPGSVEEAQVGIYAELAGVVAPPIIREETGAAEFVDENQIKYDVKSPKSPPPGAKWAFDAAHQIVKIRHDQSNGEKVLLNLSKCTPGDTSTLILEIMQNLNPEELKNLSILMNRENV